MNKSNFKMINKFLNNKKKYKINNLIYNKINNKFNMIKIL